MLEAIDRFEERYETYDAFVPELRAWGQSPIYAIAWRTLYADVIAQLHEHDELGEHLDRGAKRSTRRRRDPPERSVAIARTRLETDGECPADVSAQAFKSTDWTRTVWSSLSPGRGQRS